VLAGVELAGAGAALVCGALLSAAGAFCAIAGTPKLAANNIAAIEPGVAVPFVTISLCRPKRVLEEDAHTRRFRTCPTLLQATGQIAFTGE
jgi:hypothetical protein